MDALSSQISLGTVVSSDDEDEKLDDDQWGVDGDEFSKWQICQRGVEEGGLLDELGIDNTVPCLPEQSKLNPLSPSSSHDGRPTKKKKLNYSHVHHQANWQEQALQFRQWPSIKTLRLLVKPATELKADINTKMLPSCKGAYIATWGSHVQADKHHTLASLISIGFTLEQWNGMYAIPSSSTNYHLANPCFRTPRPLVDTHGRVWAVLARRPNDPTYIQAAQLATKTMLLEGEAAKFKVGEIDHC